MSKNHRTIKCGPWDFGFKSFLLVPISKSGQLLHLSRKVSALLNLVGVTGFEPVTLRLSSACSNQLSYTPDILVGVTALMVEAWGFEPQTYSLQSYRSTN